MRQLRVVLPSLLLAALLAFPGLVPNTPGRLGSLIETGLPWFGLLIPLLLVWAALRRSAVAVAAALLPAVVWSCLFLPGLAAGAGRGGGRAEFQVLTLNVGAERTVPRDVAREVIATDADVVALEKVPPSSMPAYEAALAAAYPHHTARASLGLWSRYPLRGVEWLNLNSTWPHAVRAVARTPGGDTAFYAVRLPSVRVRPDKGFTIDNRDAGARALADRVGKEPTARVVLLGDLNGSLRDRGLEPLTRHLASAHDTAGQGFGFTWPGAFPLVPLDHVLLRGLTATTVTVLPDIGSDHRPVLAGLRGG